MTDTQKVEYVKLLSGITDNTEDTQITAFLELTAEEIINWQYHLIKRPEGVSLAPEYETVQVQACAAGYGQIGGTGETTHSENGISRTWKYADMLMYIQSHVPAFVKFI